MELKEGMYVRTLDGISKVVEVRDSNTVSRFVNEDRNIYFMNEIIGTPSFDIIDLVQKGDYVNGYYVTTGNQNVGSIYIAEIDGLGLKKKLYNKDIQSIVTKEQFEEISYKIGEQ